MKRLFYALALSLPLCTAAENPPLMGWSSWNTYGFQINDSVIQAQADAMVGLGFKDCGYNHINIDDGFFGGRDAEGNLLIHPERFPNGLRGLVDYIHAKGLKAGIYSDAGRNTCASYWGKPKDEIGRGVGLYGHDAADFDLYFNPDKLNFDFIKIDYCGADAGNNDEGLDLDVEQRYKEIAAALKAVGRDDVTWNICRWAFPGTWACGIADSWRTTEDIYLGWESVKSIINQSLYLSAYTSYGHYNDMDMLEVGRGLTDEEDKTHFGMWCIMSSPLLIGCDMNDIKGNALELMQNKELIALNQNTLGLQAYVVKRENGGYVLVKDVEEKYGTKRAVAFYNPTNAAIDMSISFEQVDLAGEVAVRDLFEKRNLGVYEGAYSVTVPAHGTRIYKFDAEERLERTLYEAETAWLTDYQEIKNNEVYGTAIYAEKSNCSGGVAVGWLGNRDSNDLQWRNVYSRDGGEYTLRVYFITGENRTMKLSVNGGEPQVYTGNSGGWGTVGSAEFDVVLKKGENVVRLFNENGYMGDIDKMVLVNKNAPVVTVDYPIVFDKNQGYTHGSRRLNSVSLSGQTLQLPTPLKVYSKIDDGCFNAKAGETVAPSFGFTGTWMNGFVYIDRGQDGAFEAKLNADGSIPAGSDIMAFSYAEPSLGSGTGYNSNGERVSNTNVLNPPAFTVPADLAPGFYRMRYKVDWASIDPAGRAEDGNGILQNGGAICDVVLNVHNDNGAFSVVAENGALLAADGSALPSTVPFAQPLTVKVVPSDGYVLDVLKVLHGHNLDGDAELHGVKQYREDIISGTLVKDGKVTIPAEYIDGDVVITAVFANAADGVGGDGYALSFDKDAQVPGEHRYLVLFNRMDMSPSGPDTYRDAYRVATDEDQTGFYTLEGTRDIDVIIENFAGEDIKNVYMYIDLNNDGKFVALLNEDGLPAMSSELVAFSCHNGIDSEGNPAQKGAVAILPTVVLDDAIPAGVYRMRLKLDTDNINPGGSENFVAENGLIIDYLISIAGDKRRLTLHTVDGSIDGVDNTALPMMVENNEMITYVLRGAPGYKCNKVIVRHGYNLDGEQYVNGNLQWREVEEKVNVNARNHLVPAWCLDGDVALFAEFEPEEGCEWQLVFSDEFNAEDMSQPVDEKWMRCQRYGATWNRWLSDSKEVIYLQGGDLVARAIPNPDQASDPVPMITGGIKSNNRFGFTYGYVEARIKSNPWTGNFPAFWMMPENQSAGWPDCGEIDIWETIDSQERSWHTVHSNWTYDLHNTNNPQSSFNVATSHDRYHTYGLKWDETTLIWYVDGKEVGRYAKSTNQSYLDQGQWPFDKHFHLILNQSVGNNAWAADADVTHTYETRFDWVRVYQTPGMENTNGTVGVVSVLDDANADVRVADNTVIVSVDAPRNVAVYDVSGRKVAEDFVRGTHCFALSSGVYVVEGVKVVVK
ncbi:MAG: family 16 glycosylhydrolase [Bacteroidaceae bacterium]|nr:family 16 glycosylhydrolase [Bacteroidaceae bacterium]